MWVNGGYVGMWQKQIHGVLLEKDCTRNQNSSSYTDPADIVFFEPIDPFIDLANV